MQVVIPQEVRSRQRWELLMLPITAGVHESLSVMLLLLYPVVFIHRYALSGPSILVGIPLP
jgi:hypothetical protein